MVAAQLIGRSLADLGVEVVFGLMGSGNLTMTNALRDGGARFVGARHETGAVAMADGYARVSAKVGVCSVHQGPGVTNATTALTEAAKARTPLLVLAGDTPPAALRSNFRIDQDRLARAVGAVPERVYAAASAAADAQRAFAVAARERRAVLLSVPIDVQAQEAGEPTPAPAIAPPAAVRPAAEAVAAAAELLAGARQPVILAGRGAARAGAGPALRELGERAGAILATSAPANGLFAGDPWCVGISGGFASPLAAELVAGADVIVAFGATLNPWTTRHGALVAPDCKVVQVDVDARAIGAHRPAHVEVIGDARATAQALAEQVRGNGARTDALRDRIARGAWRDVEFEDRGAADVIDPRTLTIALDDLLAPDRTVVVDSGHFMGYPSMYLRVPDERGFVFPQAFQCVGLALGCAIGAHLARPDRLTVAAVGDGGMLLALPELETLGRLRLPMLVVVYDDAAYGAEVHHFRGLGQEVDLAQFPPTDFAALARAAGCDGLTVRNVEDLAGVSAWLERRERPLVVDAKVDPDICAEWLEEAFRAH
jgi:thiamine pyrophosphate-dependent acetolactate synthase large subunit-like protein